MERRRVVMMGVLLLCGCKSGGWSESIADATVDAAGSAIGSALGDNPGPLVTGETRGQYRDRSEVERLGDAGFRRVHGRPPDLARVPDSADW